MSNRTESHERRRQASKAIVLVTLLTLVGSGAVTAQAPKITPPQPTVPEIFTLQGQYVRIAYNNEGFASLGYRMAQDEVGKEWMLLEVGITLRKPTPDYRLKREDLSITTPDGKTIPLATQKEYSEGMGVRSRSPQQAGQGRQQIRSTTSRWKRTRPVPFSSLPTSVDPGAQRAYDETELTWRRACFGPALLPGSRGYPDRPALAQHQLCQQLPAGAVPNSHQGRSEAVREALARRSRSSTKRVSASRPGTDRRTAGCPCTSEAPGIGSRLPGQQVERHAEDGVESQELHSEIPRGTATRNHPGDVEGGQKNHEDQAASEVQVHGGGAAT